MEASEHDAEIPSDVDFFTPIAIAPFDAGPLSPRFNPGPPGSFHSGSQTVSYSFADDSFMLYTVPGDSPSFVPMSGAPNGIRGIVHAHYDDFVACAYAVSQLTPIRGRIVLHFEIDGSGVVRHANATPGSSVPGLRAAVPCFESAARRMRFNWSIDAGYTVLVDYPLVIQPQ